MLVLGRFVAPSLAAAPASPSTGEVYWDTSLGVLRVWDGAAWDSLGASTSGGATIKTVEVDLGTTPVQEAIFTVTDAAVTTSSKIMAQQAYAAVTGKSADEQEMDPFQVIARPLAGQILFMLHFSEGQVNGVVPINYQIA